MRRKNLFPEILRRVCLGIVQEPFGPKDFPDLLDKSHSFIDKHSLKPDKVYDEINGIPFFIWVSPGKFKINPVFKTCV